MFGGKPLGSIGRILGVLEALRNPSYSETQRPEKGIPQCLCYRSTRPMLKQPALLQMADSAKTSLLFLLVNLFPSFSFPKGVQSEESIAQKNGTHTFTPQ